MKKNDPPPKKEKKKQKINPRKENTENNINMKNKRRKPIKRKNKRHIDREKKNSLFILSTHILQKYNQINRHLSLYIIKFECRRNSKRGGACSIMSVFEGN